MSKDMKVYFCSMAIEDVVLKVDGMTCSNCAAGISKTLKKSGFKDAHASFSDGEVSFTLVESHSKNEAVKKIESLGYSVVEGDEAAPKGLSSIEKKFLFSLILSLPLFLHMFVPQGWWINNPIVQISLATPVFILGTAHFGRSAWGSIKAGMANMDVLIFIGSSAAYFYSLAGTFMNWGTPKMHEFMFFETAAMIITLVLLGNVIEYRAVKKTSEQIGELTKLQSAVARIVMRVNGKEKLFETEPKAVKIGDELQINQGDHVPIDGTILSGNIEVDESAITGESAVVVKKIADQLFSGTTILEGNCRIEATATAKDSTLEKIISLVKRARREQPDIQILGDKVSGIFVPVVLGIASLTFLLAYFVFEIGLTQSIMNSIAVLVISCPCAMGLATPTAVVAGIGRAAKAGILLKGGNTLERFAKADVILFDKTGTLTTGKFSMELAENEIGLRAKELIKSLENHSSHPIARSLVSQMANTEGESISEIREVKGFGMQGKTLAGEEVFFGKDEEGKSDLILQLNGNTVCRVSIEDSIKKGAKEMVDAFKKAGLETRILSGDREKKVAQVAKKLGIKAYHAAMKPDEKLKYIETLSESKTVVMVGDGINDGPSLSRAQVGISPGGATSLAIDSARIVLMRHDEMKALVEAFKISQHTYKTIKQNLFWAFFYNALAIPIAAVGLLNPMVAALSMAFSDVIVIGNSLRLKVKKID
ncbi:MAG: Cu+-exporting ATPase [Flammeovirgaceae bacterium]|jgi:Cu+-exporting ATPase